MEFCRKHHVVPNSSNRKGSLESPSLEMDDPAAPLLEDAKAPAINVPGQTTTAGDQRRCCFRCGLPVLIVVAVATPIAITCFSHLHNSASGMAVPVSTLNESKIPTNVQTNVVHYVQTKETSISKFLLGGLIGTLCPAIGNRIGKSGKGMFDPYDTWGAAFNCDEQSCEAKHGPKKSRLPMCPRSIRKHVQRCRRPAACGGPC